MAAADRKRTIPRERIVLAEKLYLDGKPTPRILRRLCDDFGVSTRQARKYLALVRAKLAALPKPDPAAEFQRIDAMLSEAFRCARRAVKVVKWEEGDGAKPASRIMPAPDTGAMVAAAARLADLHGVAAPKRSEVSGPGGGPIPIESASTTPDALHARLAALAARVAGSVDPGADRGPDGSGAG